MNEIKSESEAICRLCARQKDDCNIDVLVKNNQNILQRIKDLLNVKIKPKDECHNICLSCNGKLEMCYEFYEEVQIAQTHLKEKFVERNRDTFETIIKEEINIEPEIKIESPDLEVEPLEFESHIFQEERFYSSNEDSDSEISEKVVNEKGDKSQTDEINKFYKFKCSKCKTDPQTYVMYQTHMKKVHRHENPTIRCMCNMLIPCQKMRLVEHYLMHTNPEELQCRVCSKQHSNKKTLRRHEKCHGKNRKKGPPIPCPECKKVLSDRTSLQSHMKNVHTPEDMKKKYICDLCGKKLTTKFSILNHLIVKHKMEAENGLTNTEEILCPFCAKSFKNKSTYYYHYQVKHNITMTVCPECGIEMNKKSLRSHMRRTHDHQTQNCPICHKTFRNMHAVLLHKNRVHVEPKHACDICGKMFKMKDKLKEHRKGHIIENRFQCDMCNVANNDYANILKHRKQVHPNATPIPHGMGKKMLEIGYQ